MQICHVFQRREVSWWDFKWLCAMDFVNIKKSAAVGEMLDRLKVGRVHLA